MDLLSYFTSWFGSFIVPETPPSLNQMKFWKYMFSYWVRDRFVVPLLQTVRLTDPTIIWLTQTSVFTLTSNMSDSALLQLFYMVLEVILAYVSLAAITIIFYMTATIFPGVTQAIMSTPQTAWNVANHIRRVSSETIQRFASETWKRFLLTTPDGGPFLEDDVFPKNNDLSEDDAFLEGSSSLGAELLTKGRPSARFNREKKNARSQRRYRSGNEGQNDSTRRTRSAFTFGTSTVRQPTQQRCDTSSNEGIRGFSATRNSQSGRQTARKSQRPNMNFYLKRTRSGVVYGSYTVAISDSESG